MGKLVQRILVFIAALVLVIGLAGCQFLREVSNLRDVDFAIDRVTDGRLAGINLSEIQSYRDLRPQHLARITAALAQHDLPLDFSLQLTARNPDDNTVPARLVTMDWTVLLDDRETVSGTYEDTVVIPPGESREVTIPITLDLLRFFQENARDLIDLALAVSGQGGKPQRIALRATPIVKTRLGDIRYTEPIVIESREIGQQ